MSDVLTGYYLKLKLLDINERLVRIRQNNLGYVLYYVDYNYPEDTFKVPDFIYRLEDSCFSGTRFKKIVIGENVKEIGENCFANCNSLSTLIVPESLKSSLSYLRQSNNAEIVWGYLK